MWKAKAAGGKALLLILGLTLAGALSEGLVRLAVQPRPAKDGYSPVRGRRATGPMNAAGYRDVEHTLEKPPGVRRAVFVGDSFTYGAGILLDDTYAKRAVRGLSAARSEDWESIVLAVPGIDTEQEAAIVEREALAYSPDLLVLGYVINDAEDPGAAEQRRARDWAEAKAAKKNPPAWRRSALLSFVAGRLHAERESRQRIENHLALYREGSPGFSAVRRSLARIASVCRKAGIPFVVLMFPLFANPLDASYPFGSIHQQVGEAVRSTGATFVDTFPYYRELDWRLLTVEGESDEHPNELAHRIAAQSLLAALEPMPLGSRRSPPDRP